MPEIAVKPLPQQVRATLRYVVPSDEPLYNYFSVEPPAGIAASNEVFEGHEVSISNLRDLESGARLDRHGFELAHFETRIDDIYDAQQRRETYDPEIEALVKRVTGARDVRVFNHFLRGEEAQRRDPHAITAPAASVHVDNTHASGPYWFDVIVGKDAEALRGRRFAIVNVWRPIKGPLQDRPLAVCDVHSTASDDFIVSKSISRVDEKGVHSSTGEISRTEIYSVAWNPQHRWYYAPNMQTDEVLLIKCYDSSMDGASRFTPHTAFDDPSMPDNALPRASIEVRTLVIW